MKSSMASTRTSRLWLCCFELVASFCGNLSGADTATLHAVWSDRVSAQPNILLILADDLGCSDLGCYGGEMHTEFVRPFLGLTCTEDEFGLSTKDH